MASTDPNYPEILPAIDVTYQPKAETNTQDVGLPAYAMPPVTPDQLGSNPYFEATIDGSYAMDAGLVALPSTSKDGPAVAIVQLHQQLATRAVEWTVERQDKAPDLPTANTDNPNEVLLYMEINPASPIMGPDGKRFWRRSGRYVYALITSPNYKTDRFSSGCPQYDQGPISNFDIQPSDFKPQLLQSSSTIPQAFTGLQQPPQ